MKFVLASRNKKKIDEIKNIIAQALPFEFELLSLDDIGFYDEIDECGATFEENALIKAEVPARLGYAGIADDSGLCVDALGGAPGVHSARYAKEPCDDAANNEKLLSKLEKTGEKKRSAHFACTAVCVFPNGDRIVCSGKCGGTILKEPHGSGGFGYDPLFFFPEFGKTFAQMTQEEKNEVSHRKKAFYALSCELVKYFEKNGDAFKSDEALGQDAGI